MCVCVCGPFRFTSSLFVCLFVFDHYCRQQSKEVPLGAFRIAALRISFEWSEASFFFFLPSGESLASSHGEGEEILLSSTCRASDRLLLCLYFASFFSST